MLSRIPVPVQQALAALVPLISLLTAYFLAVPRYQALRRDEAELQSKSEIVATKSNLLTLAEKGGAKARILARVPADRDEPILFLRQLNEVARECGVNITSITNSEAPIPLTPAAPVAPGGLPGAPATTIGLPPDTTSRDAQLSVTGPFRAMALFFASLENYKRLISVSNATMTAPAQEGGDLTAQFKLTRYVGPPSLPAPAVPAAAAR